MEDAIAFIAEAERVVVRDDGRCDAEMETILLVEVRACRGVVEATVTADRDPGRDQIPVPS